MTTLGVILTVVALLATATAILLFERRRAEGIERDLRDAAEEQREAPHRPPED